MSSIWKADAVASDDGEEPPVELSDTEDGPVGGACAEDVCAVAHDALVEIDIVMRADVAHTLAHPHSRKALEKRRNGITARRSAAPARRSSNVSPLASKRGRKHDAVAPRVKTSKNAPIKRDSHDSAPSPIKQSHMDASPRPVPLPTSSPRSGAQTAQRTTPVTVVTPPSQKTLIHLPSPFLCPFDCGASFTNLRKLKVHLEIKHLRDEPPVTRLPQMEVPCYDFEDIDHLQGYTGFDCVDDMVDGNEERGAEGGEAGVAST